MDELRIRAATASDAENISSLIRDLAHYFTIDPSGKGGERFLSSIRVEAITAAISNPSFRYQLASIDEKLVGVAAVRENRHLYHLFVARDFHRRGVGRALWQKAKADAITAGNSEGFTVNSTPFAVPVYERFGFCAEGSKVEREGISIVPMRLALSELFPPADTHSRSRGIASNQNTERC